MKFRCQVVVGENDATNEYIACGASAPFFHSSMSHQAHLCHAHHVMLKLGQEFRFVIGPIQRSAR